VAEQAPKGSDLERQRISAIAHAGSPMWGPVGEETIGDLSLLAERHGIDASSRILDLGCGPAELLRRICESTGATGTGVDASPFALAEARRRLDDSPASDLIDLRLGDATTLEPRGDHDLVLCVGPGWTSGGWTALAAWASGFVAPGRLVLLGEGAWRVDPPPDALARLGMGIGDYLPSSEVPAALESTGASVIWSRRATAEEWAAYADRYRTAMRTFARDDPDDPVTPAVRQRAEAGWADYETLHELLDFVLVLATVGGDSEGSIVLGQ
jgi:SAM-dependent methyltransferase